MGEQPDITVYAFVETPSSGDPETDAISLCLAAVKNLSLTAQLRVAGYVFSRLSTLDVTPIAEKREAKP